MKIKLKVVLTIIAFPLLFMGLAMTFASSSLLVNLGHAANSASLHFARATGGAAIALAVMAWMARNTGPSQARNALVTGLGLFFLLEAIVDIRAIMVGTYSGAMWFTGVLPWLVFLGLIVIAARGSDSGST